MLAENARDSDYNGAQRAITSTLTLMRSGVVFNRSLGQC